MNALIQELERDVMKENKLTFRTGDTVRVTLKVREGDKERLQAYEGVVIAINRGLNRTTFTVRKVSYGVGVERIFPLYAPTIDSIEIIGRSKVRRARLYYLRNLFGKAAKLKDLRN